MFLKKEFNEFLESDWELKIFSKDKIIYESKESGVKGLLDFLQKDYKQYQDIVVFDKIVGRAAAFLMILFNAKEIFGAVGSETAGKVLEDWGIKFHSEKTIPNILNLDKTDLCPMEKLSAGKTPEEFYQALSH
jgi:hypothetical protein